MAFQGLVPCLYVFFYCDMKMYGVHVCVCMVADTLYMCGYYLLMRYKVEAEVEAKLVANKGAKLDAKWEAKLGAHEEAK